MGLSYWRLASGLEVDFIVGDMETAIEAKAVERVNDTHIKGLRHLKKNHPEIKQRFLVALVARDRLSNDGIHILSYGSFLSRLWKGDIVAPHQ